MHALASECICLNVKLPRNDNTLNLFVNDAIGYRMNSEQPLFYSENCFGTADAICFRHNLLRIHDLKTGENPASMDQLMVYAALFCLEYSVKPESISIELRIYQANEVSVYKPTPEEIAEIMDIIVRFDKILVQLKMDERNNND